MLPCCILFRGGWPDAILAAVRGGHKLCANSRLFGQQIDQGGQLAQLVGGRKVFRGGQALRIDPCQARSVAPGKRRRRPDGNKIFTTEITEPTENKSRKFRDLTYRRLSLNKFLRSFFAAPSARRFQFLCALCALSLPSPKRSSGFAQAGG